MSPKARDTDMSPHMRPSTIYKKKNSIFQLCKNKSQLPIYIENKPKHEA